VWISIIGASTGYPAIQVSRAVASANAPSTVMPISADVPPTSKVISDVRPDSAPLQAPPRTPAAGPESRVRIGFSATIFAVAAPPFDPITCRSQDRPLSRIDAARWLT
jgi:hypothetical protein